MPVFAIASRKLQVSIPRAVRTNSKHTFAAACCDTIVLSVTSITKFSGNFLHRRVTRPSFSVEFMIACHNTGNCFIILINFNVSSLDHIAIFYLTEMVIRNYVNADVITQYDVIGCNLHSCRNRLLVVYTQGDRRSNCRQKSNMFDTSNCRHDWLLEVYTRGNRRRNRETVAPTIASCKHTITCSKKLTGSQLSLPHRINKKLKCETKNKMMNMIDCGK